MKHWRTFCIGIVLVLPFLALAQEDTGTFTIGVFGGEDVEAPSVPSNLIATATTPVQIDVTWSSSTDNFLVDGYVIYRGEVGVATSTPLVFAVLATTTQPGYVDTGLIPETTYAYYVRAFDRFLNYSASSSIATTTTPAVPAPIVPPTPQPAEPTEQTAVRATAEDIVVSTEVNSVQFDVTMARPSSLQLRWGRTGSYELGYVSSDVFLKKHTIPLDGLEPRTTYEYQLIGFTPYGPAIVLDQGTFMTEGVLLEFLPENVSRFQAVTAGADVELSWELPSNRDDIAYVRVLRSHLGFPTHLEDGAVIYQDRETRAALTDEGILNTYSPVYYTAFVVDINGQVSSGAVAIAYADIGATEEVIPPLILLNDTGPTIVSAPSSTIDEARMDEYTRLPQLTDITITQGELVGDPVFTLADPAITLHTDVPFVISLPKRLVSNNLKSIIVSVLDPTDTRQAFAYLLRLNQTGDAYEATIPALLVAGRSQVTVEIFDYESFVVSSYYAPVEMWVADEAVTTTEQATYTGYVLVGAGLLLFWFVILWRRRTEDNAS